MKNRLILLALVLCIPLILTGCGEGFSWNQKLIIEVDTPGSVVSASSVTSVRYVLNAGLMDLWDGRGVYATGEAVTIDLGDSKYVFALLKNSKRLEGVTHWAFYAFPSEERKTWPLIGPMIESSDLRFELNGENQPMLVTFDDINDPASVKEVDPANLASTFGPGYSLQSITLEITDDPVTEGEVEEVLGWLNQFTKTQLDGQRLRNANALNPIANSLNILSFIRN